MSSGQSGKIEDADSHFQHLSAHAHLLRKHIGSDTNLVIQDLGCGNGEYLYHLAKWGYAQSSGVEISGEQVALGQRFGVKNIIQADILTHLKRSPDQSVDVFLLIDVLEHFQRDEMLEVLDECYRVLKAGGNIILHVPNAEGIFGARVRYGDLTHEWAFTADSVRQLMYTCGFSVVRCYENRPLGRGLKA